MFAAERTNGAGVNRLAARRADLFKNLAADGAEFAVNGILLFKVGLEKNSAIYFIACVRRAMGVWTKSPRRSY